ncbi:MAG: protein-disulfide reductase DsbD domain-containing protein [Pseudomonadota bacterium]
MRQRLSWLALVVVLSWPNLASAMQTATKWSVGHKSQTRLIVGSMPGDQGQPVYYAGLEIKMEPGWKTYWRQPGDDGGIPPYFNWSKSVNLKDTKVLFPTPKRFSEATGESIGYKKHVVLPVAVQAMNASSKLGLAVQFEYGVCREICIPAQAKLALEVDLKSLRQMPPQLARAIASVPVSASETKPGLPQLLDVAATYDGPSPMLKFRAAFPGDGSGADLFVDAGRRVYLPMTKKAGQTSGSEQVFEIDLSKGVQIGELKGKAITVTMISNAGSIDVEYTLPK